MIFFLFIWLFVLLSFSFWWCKEEGEIPFPREVPKRGHSMSATQREGMPRWWRMAQKMYLQVTLTFLNILNWYRLYKLSLICFQYSKSVQNHFSDILSKFYYLHLKHFLHASFNFETRSKFVQPKHNECSWKIFYQLLWIKYN
jgi:hypothetical protein